MNLSKELRTLLEQRREELLQQEAEISQARAAVDILLGKEPAGRNGEDEPRTTRTTRKGKRKGKSHAKARSREAECPDCAAEETDGWMTKAQLAASLELKGDNIGYQLKKLVDAGTVQAKGVTTGRRYRVVRPEGKPESLPVEKEGVSRAVTSTATSMPVTVKAAVRWYVEVTPARGRFTRDQAQAEVARQRGGNITNDEQAQVGIHLAELVKLGILECTGSGRLAIYTKR